MPDPLDPTPRPPVRDWHPVRLAGIPAVAIALVCWLLGWEATAIGILLGWITVALVTIVVLAWREAKERTGRG